ncbi:unnamed protein product [Miscanthus lutarioriparius]|uniref:Uncharacterized protein n=1 Tax=Miscanthus lutarioriparius TaxID=422564 RepID=A0A811MQ45_9POAL|nr:unnamed protein product [Miscanthus lutarioriparius]
MAVFASARDADAGARVLEIRKELEADCGHLSASQADLLARAHFLGGGGGVEELEADCGHISASQADLLARAHFLGGCGCGEEEEEAEVFSTPPLTQQDPQRQGQSQRGQAGEGEDGIAMCSMPFTQTQPSSPSSASSSSSDSRPRKPRKPRIWTATATPTPTPSPSPELDPLRQERAHGPHRSSSNHQS